MQNGGVCQVESVAKWSTVPCLFVRAVWLLFKVDLQGVRVKNNIFIQDSCYCIRRYFMRMPSIFMPTGGWDWDGTATRSLGSLCAGCPLVQTRKGFRENFSLRYLFAHTFTQHNFKNVRPLFQCEDVGPRECGRFATARENFDVKRKL